MRKHTGMPMGIFTYFGGAGTVDSTRCAAMKNKKKYWTKKQEKAQVGTYTGTFNEKRSYGKSVTP